MLQAAACVACEDTRRTAKLLARFGIQARMLSCHRFNERERLEPLLGLLREGKDVALVSDGGTPGIADPGSLLVRAALEEGLRVSPVPGPSAVAAALSASGSPADRFVFDGFLPHRAGERRRRLRELSRETRTVVVFETPHRIRSALRDLAETMGDRRIVLGRELSKAHETVLCGNPGELLAMIGPDPVRGEICLVIEGATSGRGPGSARGAESAARDAWRAALEAAGGDRREALRAAAKMLGLKRAALYRLLEELGEIVSRESRFSPQRGPHRKDS